MMINYNPSVYPAVRDLASDLFHGNFSRDQFERLISSEAIRLGISANELYSKVHGAYHAMCDV
jgi:hypothetical protein